LDKIQEIIRKLRRMKTPGTDNINAELLQAAGPQMTQRIQGLILIYGDLKECLMNGTSQ